jgi:hypothetical protein
LRIRTANSAGVAPLHARARDGLGQGFESARRSGQKRGLSFSRSFSTVRRFFAAKQRNAATRVAT